MIGQFTSFDGKIYTVQIGTDTEPMVLSADAVHITYDGVSHQYTPIRGCSATIRIVTDRSLHRLYTASPLGRQVTIKEGSRFVFVGFLTPQEWKTEVGQGMIDTEVMAIDAISALKTVPYLQQSTAQQPRQAFSPSEYISKALAIINQNLAGVTVSFDASSLPWNEQAIYEGAFLPSNPNAGTFDKDRTFWADIISAIGTFLQHSFVMMGNDLVLFDADNNSNIVELDNSFSVGAQMEIEPAKSSIEVKYQPTAINFVPELTADTIGPQIIEHMPLEAPATDDGKKTLIWHRTATTWNGYEAIIRSYDHLDGFADESYCVIGPSELPIDFARGANTRVVATVEVWARNDVNSQGGYGYPMPPVFGKKSNIGFKQMGLVAIEEDGTEHNLLNAIELAQNDAPKNNYGFTSSTVITQSGFEVSGPMKIVVPAGVVIRNLRITSSASYTGKEFRHVLSEDYNEDMTIDAKLKATPSAMTIFEEVKTSTINKYPYCNPIQFAVPRPRYTFELHNASIDDILRKFKLPERFDQYNYYLPTSLDVNLRDNTETIDLLQSHEQFNREPAQLVSVDAIELTSVSPTTIMVSPTGQTIAYDMAIECTIRVSNDVIKYRGTSAEILSNFGLNVQPAMQSSMIVNGQSVTPSAFTIRPTGVSFSEWQGAYGRTVTVWATYGSVTSNSITFKQEPAPEHWTLVSVNSVTLTSSAAMITVPGNGGQYYFSIKVGCTLSNGSTTVPFTGTAEELRTSYGIFVYPVIHSKMEIAREETDPRGYYIVGDRITFDEWPLSEIDDRVVTVWATCNDKRSSNIVFTQYPNYEGN